MTYHQYKSGFADLLDLPFGPNERDIPATMQRWWPEFRGWPESEWRAAIRSYRSALPCAVCKAAPRFPIPEQLRAHASKGVLEKLAAQRNFGCERCEEGWVRVITEGGEAVGVKPCPYCRQSERKTA